MTATALKPPPSYPAREMADTLADYQSAAGGTTKLGALLKEQMRNK